MSDPAQYTVGWICALQKEYVAARAFLDKKHSQPETLSPNDNNHYTLGEIKGHQVVIAVLPDGEYRTSAAASDVRLGNIIMSLSWNGHGGLLQYDFGKELQGQEFYQTGFLNQPPLILRTAVSGLQVQYEEEGHLLQESVETVLEHNRRLKQKYAQPPPESDRLYKSQFIHPDHQASCAKLSSGNRVIKDAIFRDKLAADQDILCFEMEAAGLMNHFLCYAAMLAAAYARDLLHQIIPQQVKAEQKASEVLDGIQNQLDNVSKHVDNIHSTTGGSAQKINDLAESAHLNKLPIAEGAEFGTYIDQHEDECLEETRTELLLNSKEWAALPEGECMFWLNDQGLLGASFFFKRGEADRGNAARFFPTITKQLFTTIPDLRAIIIQAIKDNPTIAVKPLKAQFNELIHKPFCSLKQQEHQSSPLVIVVDALDECEQDNDIKIILQLLPRFETARNSYQDLILHDIPEPPGKPDIQVLLTMSVPLFIFAATILKYQNQESKLDGTYLPVTQPPYSKYSGARQKQLVQEIQEVIGTIILLESPLSVVSLSKLMGISTVSINARLNSLHSVLNIPANKTLPVRLFHLSFQDFLLDYNTCEKTLFWVEEKQMNRKLTGYCLSVMHNQLKKNMCNQSINSYLSPELQYSCCYWTHHLARSKDPMSQLDKVLAFLNNRFLHWVEVMSMLGVSALQGNKDSGISKCLYDAKRFILKNSQIADIAPLQLYASGLTFAPKTAITKKNFEKEVPGWIAGCSSVEEVWSPELTTLEGHSDLVQSIAFSPDGQLQTRNLRQTRFCTGKG
ncbi:hypothetical protein BDW59DRAFT_180525 [Aspergillus cavernicola]|uniref:Nephrocystin 3-like N-terminal domain-containing protein n=1 Tax=Aspergillus cavernicola TaxID=176166 RepID=A0ABR4J1L5_9EURO